MVHRLNTTRDEFIGLCEGAQLQRMLVDDDGFSDGDIIYLLYHEDDRLKYLLCRTVVSVDREAVGLPAEACILTVH